MIRVVLGLLVFAVVITGAVFLADNPGQVEILWGGWMVQASVGVLVAASLSVALMASLVFRIASLIAGGPRALLRHRRERRRHAGYRAISQGMIAITEGNTQEVLRNARRAAALLPDPSDASAGVVLEELAALVSRLRAQVALPARITTSVRTGLQDAISQPKLINYDGFILADVLTSDNSGSAPTVLHQSTISRDGVVKLSWGKRYQLEVSFATFGIAGMPPESPRIFKRVHIDGGIDSPSVPFRLHIDFGTVRTPLAERPISVPRTGPSNKERFEFTAPSAPPSSIPSDQSAEELRATPGPEILSPIWRCCMDWRMGRDTPNPV